ncbi:RimK family protein [Candidatus Thalassolituus haligoni]|uniref:RimK family protein n=1 Tax=Candidatus Thalassolituus haligoni TaxID=3100113 RepID=UPI00351123CF
MPAYYVVVDDLNDWAPYFPSKDVISFEQYLALPTETSDNKVRVINCCRNSHALGRGYYASLLAEARGHHIIPSITVFNDVRRKALTSLQLEGLEQTIDKLARQLDDSGTELVFRLFFGRTPISALAPLGKQLFERFAAPILEVRLRKQTSWTVDRIRVLALGDLKTEQDQTDFADAVDQYSNLLWRKPRTRKRYRFDLAMLVNPDEAMPPSDRNAIARFVRAGKRLGINVSLIGKKDYMRLPEYDGLFIRETTNIDHHTYRFAKKAEAEGLVVMDDPTSILRCTNKVYLADLLKTHRIGTPATRIISQQSEAILQDLEQSLGFPMVLKTPDGSFSRGVIKVSDRKELETGLKQLRQKSALVLAQEYMFTDYDWRIGVLNNKPLFACRYFMVKDHWQIYQHHTGSVDSGGFETMPTYDVPRDVLDIALRATRLIGDGLYGVDIKQSGSRVVVIEVNDNPSIDSEVEDLSLGAALYHEIMAEFLRRMEDRYRG